MQLTWLDIFFFVSFFLVVVGVSMYKSRRETTSEDFFLASRDLLWPFIGLSLRLCEPSWRFTRWPSLGARLTGPGFGECALLLTAKEKVGEIAGAIQQAYCKKFRIHAAVITVTDNLESDIGWPLNAQAAISYYQTETRLSGSIERRLDL